MTTNKKNIERVININKDWKFCWAGDCNHEREDISHAYQVNYNDETWRQLDLPHDWSIEFDFNIDNSLVGSEAGYLDGGIGWYRKAFVLPEEIAEKRVFIHFGGVYMDSTVYVNGKQVGKYPNGYTPFTYDLTEYLVADGMTENVIAVKVVNEQPSSRWYSGSGIYREVELMITDPVHIVEYGTFITTPNIEVEYPSGTVTTHIQTEVKNASKKTQQVKVRAILLDYVTAEVVAEPQECESKEIQVGEICYFEQEIAVSNPKLWSIKTPYLYKISVEVIVDEQVIDKVESRCGFRWVKFDTNEGFFLNGEWMKLKGVCMHHDQGALGAVANTRAIERQMEIMQEMGSNAIRVTHNPAADELLRICDEKGLMVIDEAFDTWYGGKKQYDLGRFFGQNSSSHPEGTNTVTWAEFDLKHMVKRGRNFPCIIKWSVGNEICEASGDEHSLETIKNLKKWVAEIDPTRGITQGMDKFRFGTGEGDHEEIAKVQDTVGFNYAEGNYDIIHAKHPDWAIYGSETSSATKSRGVYCHPDSIGKHDSEYHPDYQQSSYDNDHVAWGATGSHAWIQDRDRKYVAGQFIWTGFDYIGEPTPWHNTGGPGHSLSPKSSYFGIVDTAGFPKDDYYLYQSIWKSLEESPMVHILPHWNWEDDGLRNNVVGVDGKIPLRVYSNAPHIELLIDGVSQGTQSFTQKETEYGFKYQQLSETSDKLYLEWRLDYAYVPGTTIQALAKDNQGQVVAEERIVTADKAYGIQLDVDREYIKANGEDLCYITVEIVDAKGHFVPTADQEVTFEISGEGRIVGVDNGNPISHERYKSQEDGTWKRRAFNGKALVIVQATKQEGNFTLKALAKELATDEVTVRVQWCEISKGLDYELQEQEVEQECVEKQITAFTPVQVTTEVGEVPTLPARIRAKFSTGASDLVQVEWEPIEKQQYMYYNQFEVIGKVEGQELSAKALVTVRGVIAMQAISVAAVQHIPPTLPEKVFVYYSDRQKEERPVRWNQEEVNYSQVGQVMVAGQVEGIHQPIEASIRITSEEGFIKTSMNYAKQWTGSQFPAALASFTNDMDGELDCISAVNDTIIAFEADSHNRWSNWKLSPRSNEWVGILFAEGGNITRRYIDTIRVGFLEDHEIGAPSDFNIEYYVPESEPQIPSRFGHVTEGDLAKESNWKKVEGLRQSTAQVTTGMMESFSFNFVYSYAIRLNMTRKENFKGIGITELEVYGKDAISYDTYEVKAITIDGINQINHFDETLQCIYRLDGDTFPKVKVEATNHARVTIVPATAINPTTTVEIIPENGDVTQTKLYTINYVNY